LLARRDLLHLRRGLHLDEHALPEAFRGALTVTVGALTVTIGALTLTVGSLTLTVGSLIITSRLHAALIRSRWNLVRPPVENSTSTAVAIRALRLARRRKP
jgi:hypothetical protein